MPNDEFMSLYEEIGEMFSNKEPQPQQITHQVDIDVDWSLLSSPKDAGFVPTCFTYIALFRLLSTSAKSARRLLNDEIIASRSDIKVYYTGQELCVKDETTWMALLRLARNHQFGNLVYLTKAELINELTIRNTGQNWKVVERRLERLSKAHLKILLKDKGIVVTGLLKYTYCEITGKIQIRLDPEGVALFEYRAFQPWSLRLNISDVGAALLRYASGQPNGKPHWQNLNNLKVWMHYGGRFNDFRDVILIGMKELEDGGFFQAGKSEIKGGYAAWIRTKI